MGPAPTSPRALHGWVLEASSCSFKSRRAGTSVVRVLSWAKPSSAWWDLCVVCTFLKKKVLPFVCSPRASCYLAQGALRVFSWNPPDSSLKGFRAYTRLFCWKELGFSYVWVLFVEKELGYSYVWVLFNLWPWSHLSWRSLLSDVRFLKKGHSLSVAPKPLAIWNKKLEGLESELSEKNCIPFLL